MLIRNRRRIFALREATSSKWKQSAQLRFKEIVLSADNVVINLCQPVADKDNFICEDPVLEENSEDIGWRIAMMSRAEIVNEITDATLRKKSVDRAKTS